MSFSTDRSSIRKTNFLQENDTQGSGGDDDNKIVGMNQDIRYNRILSKLRDDNIKDIAQRLVEEQANPKAIQPAYLDNSIENTTGRDPAVQEF